MAPKKSTSKSTSEAARDAARESLKQSTTTTTNELLLFLLPGLFVDGKYICEFTKHGTSLVETKRSLVLNTAEQGTFAPGAKWVKR